MQRGRLLWLIILSIAITIAVLPILSLGRLLQPTAAVELMHASVSGSWDGIMRVLRSDTREYMVLDARGDLSERLRAIGSALAVAEVLIGPRAAPTTAEAVP